MTHWLTNSVTVAKRCYSISKESALDAFVLLYIEKIKIQLKKKRKRYCLHSNILKWPTEVPSHLDDIQKSSFVGCYSFSLLNCVITNIWMHRRRNVGGRCAENCLATIFLKIAWQLYFRSVPPPPWWIVHSLTRSWADKGNSVNLLKIQSKAFLRRIESQIGISARVGTKASAGERTLNSFVAFRRKGLKFYLVPILWGSRVQWQLALALEPFPKFLPPEIYWIVGRAKSKN